MYEVSAYAYMRVRGDRPLTCVPASDGGGGYAVTAYGRLVSHFPIAYEDARMVIMGGRRGRLSEAILFAAVRNVSPKPIRCRLGRARQYRRAIQQRFTALEVALGGVGETGEGGSARVGVEEGVKGWRFGVAEDYGGFGTHGGLD